MGYRGRPEDRAQAQRRRAEAWTLTEIASELGVARSTVSLWVRDVPFVARPRNRGAPSQRVHARRAARLAQIRELRDEGVARIGQLSRKEHRWPAWPCTRARGPSAMVRYASRPSIPA